MTGVQVTFDAADPRALGAFWAEVLGYVQQPPPDGFEDWEAAMTAWGVPPERFGDHYALVDPDGDGPRIWFQRVPEPKSAKNRVHLDVNVGAGVTDADERAARIRGHARRLVSCGGTVQREVEENGERWIVMLDPEGNEFCLQ
ncbi:VOC family protein [Cellulosimicrobium cellulans]|uniref:VOC family protein n=1 Tax=Cellulosimicrobium cellulans TaxID=1710 RepID=UPI000848DF99